MSDLDRVRIAREGSSVGFTLRSEDRLRIPKAPLESAVRGEMQNSKLHVYDAARSCGDAERIRLMAEWTAITTVEFNLAVAGIWSSSLE